MKKKGIVFLIILFSMLCVSCAKKPYTLEVKTQQEEQEQGQEASEKVSNLTEVYSTKVGALDVTFAKYIENDTGNVIYLMDGEYCSDMSVILKEDTLPNETEVQGVTQIYVSDLQDWDVVKLKEDGTNRIIYLMDGYESGAIQILTENSKGE